MATIAATTGEVTIVGIGTTTITATKAGDSDYNPATARYVLTIIPKVEQAAFAFVSTNLTKSFGDAVFTFTPTGGSGTGVITYLSSDTDVATIVATTGEVAIVGGGTTTITATKAGDSDYHEATADYNLIIAKAEQAVLVFAPTSLTKTLGDAVFTFTPTGGSGTGAITYTSSNEEVATISDTSGEVTIVKVGTTTITAIKAADTDYNEATTTYTLTVKNRQAAFTFAAPAVDKTLGDAVFTFTPTGGSGIGAITWESSVPTVATISATSGEVTIGSVGTTTITATKAGDAEYGEATATYSLTVRANQAEFIFANAAVDKTLGDPVFTFTPTGGSGDWSDYLRIQTSQRRHRIRHQRSSNHRKAVGTTTITAIKAADTDL